MITGLDTVSWTKPLTLSGSQFIETQTFSFSPFSASPTLYIVSNIRINGGSGFGSGFGVSFSSPYQFLILQSSPISPTGDSPGVGASFNTVATYTFPQPNFSFDPVVAYNPLTGILHILGTRNTPTSGATSSSQLSDIIKFSYNINTETLTGPFVIAASVGSRIRSSFDIAVLENGNTIIAMSLTEPTLATGNITNVVVLTNTLTVTVTSMTTPFVSGQWVLFDGLTNAEFLNGQLVRIETSTATQFTATVSFNDYASAAESAGAIASPVGNSLLALELNASTNQPVSGSAIILDSSPSRSGNTFDGVSLLVVGQAIELYYQSHSKIFNFADQNFTINLIGKNDPVTGFGYNFSNGFNFLNPGFGSNFGVNFNASPNWDSSPTTLTTFAARYSDNRLTILSDSLGNRYMSLTYWSQLNHPEGIIGSVLVGTKQNSSSWVFHPALGSTMGGSVIQSTLSISQNNDVSLVYLLEPFVPVANPPLPSLSAWPLQVASVNPSNLTLTNVPGFYNNRNFTWLRGTKSLLDNTTSWAVIGENEVVADAAGEIHTIPALTLPPQPFTILVSNASAYFENIGVVYYPSLIPLTEVSTNPQKGEYIVDTTTGMYTCSEADAGLKVVINYNYVTGVFPVYASAWDIPPVAAISPASATVWRGGTYYATDITTITGFSILKNTITVDCFNNFIPGQQVAIYGFANPINLFLNGITLTIVFATSTSFTANIYTPLLRHGFGINFGHSFTTFTSAADDPAFAAALIPGTLVLNASSSTDADSDVLQYVWTENDPNSDVTLITTGALAAVNVPKGVGPEDQDFDVGVAVIGLFPDLVTQRNPALVLTGAAVSGGKLSCTFTAPAGAVVPIAGEQVMFYNVALGAPSSPILTIVPGGSLPQQEAPHTNAGFNYGFGSNFSNPLSVVITYINSAGETTGTSNYTISSIPADNLLQVLPPPIPHVTGPISIAEYFNVYVGAVGKESLQNFTPILISSGWTEPTTGFVSVFVFPPVNNTALEEFVNDQVFTLVEGTSSNTLVVDINLGYGYDYGFNFGASDFAFSSLVGSAITQYQFEQVPIFVPTNVPPTAVFPSPQWGSGNILTSAARNTNITITPNTIFNSATEFPVIYIGLTDPDDFPTYQWTQISGTVVSLPNGSSSPTLVIDTGGVNINGENLVFNLTLNDSVNPPFTTQLTIPVAPYAFNAANQDYLQLSRSMYSSSAPVTSIIVFNGVGTILANNNFGVGQSVWFENSTSALNGSAFTVLDTGFGQNFTAGFGGETLSSTQFQIMSSQLPNLSLVATPPATIGTAYASSPISMRNAGQGWSPLDISIIFSNLQNVKRNSVQDGSDRYIVVSADSVLVYGVFPSVNPTSVLMRKLLLPNNAQILDAVHTEQDYTLVLDSQGNIWRYSEAPFINTDNPDTQIVLEDYTSLSFVDIDQANDISILTTVSFGGQRVVVLSGEQGAFLLAMNTSTLEVMGTLTLDIASNFIFGANKIQFVRWVNMDNLNSGQILLGTVSNNSAEVTNVALGSGSFNGVAVSGNTLVITAQNNFNVGDIIVFSGMTNAAFLNGATVTIAATTANQFTASYTAPAAEWIATQIYTQGIIVTVGAIPGQQYISIANVSPNLNQNPTTSPTFWAAYTGIYNSTGEIQVNNLTPLAQSQTSGSTYETYIDLGRKQILGTFDKFKLINQFVETGEILFDPDDTYAGAPVPPVMLSPTVIATGNLTTINLAWEQERSDLITSYTVQFAIETPVIMTVPNTSPYIVQIPVSYQFTADEGVFDVTTNGQLQLIGGSPLTGQYNVTTTGLYTFNQAQAGHNVAITVQQAFQNLQIIQSGNTQTISVVLPSGRTYFFRVQANGLDGLSGFSNVVSIAI